MNRLSLVVLLSMSGLCLQAQSSSTITVTTDPVGARFLVDGQQYNSTTTFSWPAGSKHIVIFITDPALPGQPANTVQTSLDGRTKYGFNAWVDNLGNLVPGTDPIVTVTADPSITTLTANLTVSYEVFLSIANTYPNGSATPPICGAPGPTPGQVQPGVVFLGSTCYWASVSVFVPANTTEKLNAFPYPGYVFMGWAVDGNTPTAFLTSVNIIGPTVISPIFAPGKRMHFLSSPPGLHLLIDHVPVPTRDSSDPTTCPNNETQPVVVQSGFPPLCYGDFDFAPGSVHFITGVTPQLDHYNNWWVFSSWSNGQGPNALYKTDNNVNTPATLTGIFVPGAHVSFVTNPPGLKLSVDGRQNWGSYNFIWGLGTSHTIAAPSSLSDAKGRMYTFQSWSNGGKASQSVTVDQNAVNNGLRITANYNKLSRVVVQSVPSGLLVQVDGTSCATPCNVDRQSGAQVHLTAATQLPMGQGTRLDFASWSDQGASDHNITVSQDYTVITASYNTSYLLSATSNPANGAAFKYTPSSADGYYAANTLVNVSAAANPGFKFRRWTGDLSGTYPGGVVDMSVPRIVVAQMDTIPYIAPAGVKNAAGPTPSTAVAPGSIISIYGQSLAPILQMGPVNPLSQSISGVSVTVNNSYILPLMYVSPQQINAQLPSGLANGNYTLQIHNIAKPDVDGTFTIARNAPGLFFQTIGSQQYAVAFHKDGSAVTIAKPAVAGETVSFLGTGFGPYRGIVVDGFYPPNPPPAMADSVTVSLNGQTVVPTSAGAAPGYTGLTLTQFQVPAGLPAGAPATLKVTINGVDSNTVMLPLQ